MKFKYFVPYIGGGVDYTTLHINQADNAPELVGENEYAATARATVGLNFKLPSYLDLSPGRQLRLLRFGGGGVRFPAFLKFIFSGLKTQYSLGLFSLVLRC